MSPRRPLPAPPTGLRPAWPGSTVKAGEQPLYVRRGGSAGQPVAVFVHGLGGSSTNWTDLMDHLGAQLDGHAVDLPGHGRSAPPADGRYHLDGHVNAVVTYIESHQLGPVHLFGNSMGGAISTRIAAQRPDLVRSLTLISPALPYLKPVKGGDLRLPLLFTPGLSGLTRRYLARVPAEERARSVIDFCFADPSRIPAHRLAEAVDEARRRQSLPWAMDSMVGSLRGLVRAYLDRSPRNLWTQAATVTVPTLLIYGRQDRVVSFTTAAKAASAFPNSHLLVLDHVGHVAQIEDPTAVADAVRVHIDQAERALAT